MRWRALLVLGASALAILSILLLVPAPSQDAATPISVGRAQEGDVVTLRIAADVAGTPVGSIPALESFNAGDATAPTLGGLGLRVLNVSPTDVIDATLPPSEAFGNYSWDSVVNVSRVHEIARDETVSQRALERFTGQPATVGEKVTLPSWPIVVTAVSGGAVTLHADVQVGESVHRLEYWPSVVVHLTNDSMTLRDDAVVGEPVVTPASEGASSAEGNVTLVNDTTVEVDFNRPHAGQTIHVHAVVVSIKPGSSTLALVAQLVAQQASCESHHAGFVAFRGASDVIPNANGTAWVNVTVGDPWRHELSQASVSVGNATQSIATLRPGATHTFSFLVPAGSHVPVTLAGDAHFAHGGGAPDDSLYRSSGIANTAVRQQAAKVDVGAGDTGSASVTWGRWLGWLAFPLMLYPAWEGYRARQARLSGIPLERNWPRWLDLHTLPAVAATLVSVAHGGVLMLDAYRGNTTTGVWVGVVAIVALAGLGASGLVMARWVPTRWRRARGWHAGLTLTVLVLGALHALLIGSSFRFMR